MTVVDPGRSAGPWTTEHPSGPIPLVSRLDASALRDASALSTDPAPGFGARVMRRVRAWMLVPLVDFALIMLPLAWRPHQIHAVVAMAVLGTLFLTGGGRYRARLHLSVLDELPTILTRMLTATAIVTAVILYLHQRDAVITFLETAWQAIALL